MKKLIITLLLLSLSLPAFAGNLLQQEYETAKMQKIATDPSMLNFNKQSLLQDDYLTYLHNGNSILGDLKKLQTTLPKNSLDYRYINLAVQKYETVVKTYNQQMFPMGKIIIDDSDYKLLRPETKQAIGAYNFLAN